MAKLTIPDEETIATFTVTTPQDTFPFDFAVFGKADLRFRVDAEDELEQSDFLLTGTVLDGGGYQGGAVVLNTPIENCTARLWRDVRPQRAENFGPVTSVPVSAVDLALSRQMAVTQDLRRDQQAVTDALPLLADLPATVEQVFEARDEAVEATAGKADKDGSNLSGAEAGSFRQAIGIFIFRPEDFVAPGAPCGDGIVDDVVALNAACHAASQIKGAEVRLRPDGHYRVIGADLIVGVGVTVKGNLTVPGVPGSSYAHIGRIWTHLGSRLDIASNRTVRLKGACGIVGAWTNRDGLNGQIEAHDTATRDAAFAGVHITVEGDDTFLIGFMSLGAEYPWVCVGYNRPLLADIRWDASYGFKMQQTLDIPAGRDVRQFPFVTFGMPGNQGVTAEHQDVRPGVGYDFVARNDWVEPSGFFSYSHMLGFRIRVASEGPGVGEKPLTLILRNCGADGLAFHEAPWVVPGSVGMEIVGDVSEIRIITPTVAARDVGYRINLSNPNAHVTFVAVDAHGVREGMQAMGGVVAIEGGSIRGLNGFRGNTILEGTGLKATGTGRFICSETLLVEGFETEIDGSDIPGAFIGRPRLGPGAVVGMAANQVIIDTETGTAHPNWNYNTHMIVGPPMAVLGQLGTHKDPTRTDVFYFLNATVLPEDGNIDVGAEDYAVSSKTALIMMDAGDGWSILNRSVDIPDDPDPPDPAPPANLSPPTITGTLRVGSTITGNRGSWNPPGTEYDDMWDRDEEVIAGETSLTRVLTSDDLGKMIRFGVKAENADGPTTAWSAPVGPVLAAAGPITSYEAFVAAMTAKATEGARDWTDVLFETTGKFITTVTGAPSGAMRGSPWGGRYVGQAVYPHLSRVLQHCLPSSDEVAAQVAGGFVIYYEMTPRYGNEPGELGYDRNGYLSIDRGFGEVFVIAEVIYWDGSTAKVMKPFAGTGPTVYVA